jgi:predicted RNase H-like HicB family nuclease
MLAHCNFFRYNLATENIKPQFGKRNAMHKDFNVVIERDSKGFYVASVPGLKGCHTQARSLDELMERIREAIALCLSMQAKQSGRACWPKFCAIVN